MLLRYENQICHLASMHKKEEAIAPPFKQILGCGVLPCQINTDLFGTFTYEIERSLSPLECAREKCEKGLDLTCGDIGIASEGSFAPHPFTPWIASDFEVLYFRDRKLGFSLSIAKTFTQTNFAAEAVSSTEHLFAFAQKALFPSHALILHPLGSQDPNLMVKGIQNEKELYQIFHRCANQSQDRSVWVQTDMRAHKNPTRMQRIQELALELASRLATDCPSCRAPGWGMIGSIRGMVCQECKMPTELIKANIYGCTSCSTQEIIQRGTEHADPRYCIHCNP